MHLEPESKAKNVCSRSQNLEDTFLNKVRACCRINIVEFENVIIFSVKKPKMVSIALDLKDNRTLEFSMISKAETMHLVSDLGWHETGKNQHVAILVDTNAEISYMPLDGSIIDGGGEKIFAFNRFISSKMEIDYQ